MCPRRQKGSWPLWPKTDTRSKKKPNRRGSESLRPRRASDPLPSLGQGERARPPAGRPSCKQVQGPLETCAAAKTTEPGKQKTKRANAFAASRPKNGLREVPRESRKTRGAQNGTPKKPQKRKDARPEQANKTKRRGQKKKKQTTRAGGACGVLLALSCLS